MKTEYTFWEHNTSMIKNVFEWFIAVKHVFCRAGNNNIKTNSQISMYMIYLNKRYLVISINSWQKISLVVESDATRITGIYLINSKLYQNNLLWPFQNAMIVMFNNKWIKFFSWWTFNSSEWTFIWPFNYIYNIFQWLEY